MLLLPEIPENDVVRAWICPALSMRLPNRNPKSYKIAEKTIHTWDCDRKYINGEYRKKLETREV